MDQFQGDARCIRDGKVKNLTVAFHVDVFIHSSNVLSFQSELIEAAPNEASFKGMVLLKFGHQIPAPTRSNSSSGPSEKMRRAEMRIKGALNRIPEGISPVCCARGCSSEK